MTTSKISKPKTIKKRRQRKAFTDHVFWKDFLGPELCEILIEDARIAIETGSWKVPQKPQIKARTRTNQSLSA